MLCDTSNPAHLAGRENGRLKVLGCLGVLIPSLEALPCFITWLVQAPNPTLLEVFARATLVDSRKFPLH